MVTGQPSCGKTTLVKTLVELVPELDPHLCVSGFVTDEVLRRGARVGFDVVSVPEPTARGPLARKGAASRHKTGAYGVDVDAFERVALPLLAAHAGRRRLIVIDEIGRMEMHSAKFAEAVVALFDDADTLLLGSVAAPRYGHVVPLAEDIKARSDVCTLHLKTSTRDGVGADARRELRKLLGKSGSDRKRRRTD